MSNLIVERTDISDVVLLKPRRFGDHRGWFTETYNARSFTQALGSVVFVQDNQAFSAAKGTLRGLHFQRPPEPQAKLIRVLRGSIFDVAVDLRMGSPTYGRWVGETLTADGGEQLFVPRGFAHGYCTLEPDTEVAYKVDGFYAPECDAGLAWNDPTLAIAWPITPEEAILSDKDKKLPAFADFVSPFRYELAAAVA
ncbi:dTDP-4-dehydrorhamnose 3,5-epimerase [Microvirga tunisiensis]|uniref:dTDP-4-dehydrorhamnose 3,5-epimerase n=1 Tax=Microvirga tunisiensis TaxID=2108360 RepID=A0A5N7MJR7_9HYPH|nr:dTDP-4-dehydrorhamnose 3,5-epimerase [Microvirga tunisiensis]MPR08695.1 dTDP-4-dehydrorhamnose 3,5-epimerase [Microvirga tunisiensis]MPR26900.1 dTDP-4-dehydrorhamnose 3,5-epimerase [Microvirga tunisiensis]